FPNAKGLIGQYAKDGACADRPFFVTDGGAEENLGLLSALFALRSALHDIETRCRTLGPSHADAYCRRSLRPIRFVLAEASAASYDYEQDRGFSAAVD